MQARPYGYVNRQPRVQWRGGRQGGSMWSAEYQYWLSKRTRLSAGYAAVSNDANARYSIGGYTAPAGGQNQSAFITSMKTTF